MHAPTPGAATPAYDDTGPGQGTPLLLVHGHPFDRTMWRPQIARFAAGHRVVAPDLPGYGASTGRVRDWGAFVEDLVGLLDELEVPSAVVVGLSMGGQIAMELHRRHPERVAGLLLADTTAAAEAHRADRLALAERYLGEGMDPYAAEMQYRMVRPTAHPAVAEHVLAMMRATDPAGAAAAQRARAERPDYFDDLARVAVPTCVVVGADDDLTPPAEARRIAEAVPGAELVVVAGAAHLPNLERPAAFDAALARLLARVDTGAA